MKNKGFTLVELIGVIVIIAIIAAISFQAINNRIKSSEKKLWETQENNIIEAAKKYMLDNSNLDEDHVNTICVKVSSLQTAGYLENGKIIDPKTKAEVNKVGYVSIKYNFDTNQYNYYYTAICTESTIVPIYKSILANENLKVATSGDGLYETTDSYVYRGANPNNYLKIGTTTWRILSIDKESKMVKIINLSGNTSKVWDDNLITELNSDFNTGSTYDAFRDSIYVNSKWSKENIDKLDSALIVKSIEKQSNDYQTIGLLTVGEYIDASLNKNCYSNNSCNSYLSVNKNYWLLNKTSNDKNWYVSSANKLENKTPSSNDLYDINQVLYLGIDNQLNVSGNGTSSNPYVLILKKLT